MRPVQATASVHFLRDRIKPLLKLALADELDDTSSYGHKSTMPSPNLLHVPDTLYHPYGRLRGCATQAASRTRPNTARKWIRPCRRNLSIYMSESLSSMEKYFGGVADLQEASEEFIQQCQQGSTPLFNKGWTRWSQDTKQESVSS